MEDSEEEPSVATPRSQGDIVGTLQAAGGQLPARRDLEPLSVFHDVAASSQRVVQRVNALPIAQRKIERQRMRNLSTILRREGKLNANRASTTNAIGAVLGGGLLTGSVVLFASAPVTLPLIVIAASGGVVLSIGLAAGYLISNRSIEQENRAELIDNMVEEIEF